jgi:hypothetical protein
MLNTYGPLEEKTIDAYVRSALVMQGYRFDEAQILQIVENFSRIAIIAQSFLRTNLPLDAESAPVFVP